MSSEAAKGGIRAEIFRRQPDSFLQSETT